jgi:ATP-dependent Clp protease ATP-binding subunit ClpB
MTSNLGSEQLLEKIRTHGPEWTKESILNLLEPILEAHFRPEFLNRLDDILPFLPLQASDMEKIVLIQLHQVEERLRERHIRLTWQKEVLAHLAQEGYDPFYGARPLKRLIQQEVVNLLSTNLLKGEIHSDQRVELILPKGKEAKIQIKTET